MFLGFTDEQIKRYSRQIVLPGVGGRGQRKLLDARVFLVGAGGLGSPAAVYLAAAGVGKLGVCDSDRVELSNLQRQILHHTHDIGKSKVASAADAIAAINPDIEVVQHSVRLGSQNIMEIIADYDIVVEGSDNFSTKYLVNDACVLTNKPDIHAGILRFEGQVSVFIPGKGCLRCIWPVPPPPGTVPSSVTAVWPARKASLPKFSIALVERRLDSNFTNASLARAMTESDCNSPSGCPSSPLTSPSMSRSAVMPSFCIRAEFTTAM